MSKREDVGLRRLERLLVVLKRVQAQPKKRRDFDLGKWGEETEEWVR